MVVIAIILRNENLVLKSIEGRMNLKNPWNHFIFFINYNSLYRGIKRIIIVDIDRKLKKEIKLRWRGDCWRSPLRFIEALISNWRATADSLFPGSCSYSHFQALSGIYKLLFFSFLWFTILSVIMRLGRGRIKI